MSEENYEEDINFQELVGNLLNSHNNLQQDDESSQTNLETTEVSIENGDLENIDIDHVNTELPDFGAEDDYLAAVANAIQGMGNLDETENIRESETLNEPEHFKETNDAEEFKNIEELEQIDKLENIGESSDVIEKDDSQEEQNWVQALQRGFLEAVSQNEETSQSRRQTAEQLDEEDENLRNAILQSLQQLDPTEKTKAHKDQPKKSASTKSKAPKNKKKEKTTEKSKSSSPKTKAKTKTKKTQPTSSGEPANEALLNFEDVIKNLMHQTEVTESTEEPIKSPNDTETQALIDATLKAFEKELLGPATSSKEKKKPSAKKEPSITTKTKSSTASKIPSKVAEAKAEITEPSKSFKDTEASKKKKKKKKKNNKKVEQKPTDETYEDIDFSKALFEMVNQVVNKASDEPEQLKEVTEPKISELKITEPVQEVEKNIVEPSQDLATIPIETEGDEEEPFDLNQIMQRAMAMAFQEQSTENFDESTMKNFNKELSEMGVSDLLTPESTASKKVHFHKSVSVQSIKENLAKVPKEKKSSIIKSVELLKDSILNPLSVKADKSSKPQLPSLEYLKKRYWKSVKEVASISRKKNRDKSRQARSKLKEENTKIRKERQLQKFELKEKLDAERKELEEIVAKGPPYPADLRVTTKGIPKRPYRRWTPEEMAIRAAMPPKEPKRPKKVKKPKVKKAKKLKKIPLSTLKRIPIFNFTRESSAGSSNDSSLSSSLVPKANYERYRTSLKTLAPPSSISPEEMEKGEFNSSSITSSIDDSDILAQFDRRLKTVVHKEKLLFHPPWNLPEHPPISLPVARRRSKKDFYLQKTLKKNPKSRRQVNGFMQSLSINVKNTIVPAVLFPIINTLKAAAKAKVADGASPEEATKHLMTIIQHTKRSIAQSLAQSRKHSVRDYSKIKSEADADALKHKNSQIKKIPIFSLSAIESIDLTEKNKPRKPTQVKLENEDGLVDKKQGLIKDSSEVNFVQAEEDSNTKNNEVTKICKDSDKNTCDPIKDSLPLNSKLVKIEPTIIESAQLHKNDTSLPLNKSIVKENNSFSSSNSPGAIRLQRITNISNSINDRMQVPDSVNVKEMVESLVKEHISKSNDGEEVEAMPNITKIISSTITNLLPTLDGSTNGTIKKREYKKPPPPVLNLDGLKPPSLVTLHDSKFLPRNNSSKVEERNSQGINLNSIRQNVQSSVTSSTRTGTFKKKGGSEQPEELNAIKFNIPSNNDGHSKRSSAVKFAKTLLGNSDMALLTKEINKERKRKWRNANMLKNWENDVRARLNKKCKIELADNTQIEREKWVETEFLKRKHELMIKNEQLDMKTASAPSGSTIVTENEILNIITNIIKKEDVARKIEQLLIDGAGENKTKKRKRFDNSYVKIGVNTNPIKMEITSSALDGKAPEQNNLNNYKTKPDQVYELEQDASNQIATPLVKKPKLIDINTK